MSRDHLEYELLQTLEPMTFQIRLRTILALAAGVVLWALLALLATLVFS